MKRAITLIAVILATVAAWAQQVPQFNSNDYAGWTYNNPYVALSGNNIANGKVTLYSYTDHSDSIPVDKALTLVSPQFDCAAIDSVTATVIWYTEAINNSSFDLGKTALTLAIDNVDGVPVDSVTCLPTKPRTSTHKLVITVAVPHGLARARMRFVSWTGNVVSCGAIKQALVTATASGGGGDEALPGDVDGNGTIDPADISALIDHLLNGATVHEENADVNNDGSIDPSDLSDLIDLLLDS